MSYVHRRQWIKFRREFWLSSTDLSTCRDFARRCQAAAVKVGANPFLHGGDGGGYEVHLPTAIAYMAVANLLGLPFTALDRPFVPGKGQCYVEGIVVKWTYRPDGGLIVNKPPGEKMPLDVPWILVHLDEHNLGHGYIIGYRIGFDAMHDQYWRDDLYPKGFLVSPGNTYEIEDLK